jgi:hypothetical protein
VRTHLRIDQAGAKEVQAVVVRELPDILCSSLRVEPRVLCERLADLAAAAT